MRRFVLPILGLALLACVATVATSQGLDDREDKRPGKRPKGPPPKGFELGKLVPPHILEELELTEEQEKALRALEKETRKKLEKIFTEKQLRQIEKVGRRRPPPPRDKGRRPPKDDRDDRPKDEGKRPPPKDDQAKGNDKAEGGIAWFASWQDGLREAKRTGKPILLVSAAPHCAGVSGIW
jgi:hypothetical protein